MKKTKLMLTAVALLICAALSQAYAADSSEKMVFVDTGDGRECCADHDHGLIHGHDHAFCTEICQGPEGCHKGSMKSIVDQCCLRCMVFEHCDECGKTRYCNGICDECKEPCRVYEYCSNCNVKYPCEHADARCDICGKDCYCFQKCDECGHSHYFNGYCEECASRCHYVRCCHSLCEMQQHEIPDRCDCCVNDMNYAKQETANKVGNPVVVEVYPIVQGEAVAKMPLDA